MSEPKESRTQSVWIDSSNMGEGAVLDELESTCHDTEYSVTKTRDRLISAHLGCSFDPFRLSEALRET
jgi:hypothetical protein